MAFLLANHEAISSVVVFAQVGAVLPRELKSAIARLVPVWNPRNPLSFLSSLRSLVSAAEVVDVYLFNIYLTSFGRGYLTNALGLLLPTCVARLSGRPVFVYMHNLLETQEIEKLGYRPSLPVRTIVRRLESGLLTSTTMLVPLESQSRTIAQDYGVSPIPIFLPYIDIAFSATATTRIQDQGRSKPTEANRGRVARILMLGSWGPQKDLIGALRVLRKLRQTGRVFHVTIGGEANKNFPVYATRLREYALEFGDEDFTFLGHVPDSDLPVLLSEHDILLLPYTATGGQSGVLNLGAFAGLELVAYDLPQLRETATVLGCEVTFVDAHDPSALQRAIDVSIHKIESTGRATATPQASMDRLRAAFGRIVDVMRKSA